MNVYTKLISEIEKQTIYKKLCKYKKESPNKNIVFFAKLNNNTISIFNNNKILIQGEDSESVLKNILTNHLMPNINTENKLNKQEIKPTKELKEFDSYIGCDEVGVGDYFGGLTCCAVLIKNKTEKQKLISLGVKDSKKLTDAEMKKMFPEIKNIIQYSCLSLNPSEYNDLNKKFGNTHIVKTYLHNKCLTELINNIKNKDTPIILDQYVNEKKYYSYFQKIDEKPIKITIFATKSEDKYIAVACASIIARVFFLQQIEDLSKLLNTNLPLGASDKKIVLCAKEIFKNGGIENLYKYVKIDFSTTEDVTK